MRCSRECTEFEHKNLISKTNITSVVIGFREDCKLTFAFKRIKTSFLIRYRVNTVQHLVGSYE